MRPDSQRANRSSRIRGTGYDADSPAGSDAFGKSRHPLGTRGKPRSPARFRPAYSARGSLALGFARSVSAFRADEQCIVTRRRRPRSSTRLAAATTLPAPSVVYIGIVLAKIAKRVARDRMLAGSGTVGVAVSGGADSVALLHALGELYPERSLGVVHLNHCLRGSQSDRDEAFVRALAERLGHAFYVRRDHPADGVSAGSRNLEQAGRHCRYRYFRDLISGGYCAAVATAHTRSDQAETVLFRLLRGAAGAGLSGVWPTFGSGIVRPMLDVSRSEVLEYLRARGIAWREDPSNDDPAFARNRLRHALLPALRRDWNPRIEATLASTADWAVEEERYWHRRTAELRRACVRELPGELLLDVKSAGSLHPAELRRLLVAILKHPVLSGGPASFGHIEALRQLVESRAGTGAVDLPGCRAQRSFGTIRFQSGGGEPASGFDMTIEVPGVVDLPGWRDNALRTRLVSAHECVKLYNKADTALLDWDSVPGPLRLRNWCPGDRYRPAGMGSSAKIKDLFQRTRVSLWERAGWPVLATAGGNGSARIVWARRFGPALEFAAKPGSRRVLAVDEVRGVGGTSVS